MKSIQEFSGGTQPPINGTRLQPVSHTRESQPGSGQSSPERETTRYLSAATQISTRYAELVVSRILHEPFRALAPCLGADLPVIARWALKALRTRAHRDYILSAICAALAGLLALSLVWLPALALLPAALISAWLTVSWEYWERIHRTVTRQMLWDRFHPEAAPEPRREADRNRLEEVGRRRDGNLVVFSQHSAFIGSGERLRYQRLLLDVSRGLEEEDSKPKKPTAFTSKKLNAAIVAAFDHQQGLARRLSNIRVYERLFVNGMHIRNDARLLPDPLRPPPTSVADDMLTAAALHPTPQARTYVCVEMPGWEGQLVVTLFIRSVHTGDSLYIDWTFRVLPPLEDDFLIVDKLFELPLPRQLTSSLGHGLRVAIPELIRSPAASRQARRRAYLAHRRETGQAYAISNGYAFDYGAQKSIREDACGPRRRHYFLARDEVMYMLLAEQTLTRAVEDFLTDHQVDLGQFKDQMKVIFDNSIKFGDIVNSSGFSVGNNSSATTSDSGKSEA